jgi:hypothetical protein
MPFAFFFAEKACTSILNLKPNVLISGDWNPY